MKWSRVLIFSALAWIAQNSAFAAATPPSFEREEVTATRLADLVAALRMFAADHPKFIEDPAAAGIQASTVIEQIRQNYSKLTGMPYAEVDETSKEAMGAILKVITQAVQGQRPPHWEVESKYPRRLLPARLVRILSEELKTRTHGRVNLKLTTADRFLINPSNGADDWERNVIETRFLRPGWEKRKPYFERVNGAMRLIRPEYFGAACLSCHGGQAGIENHPGKIPAELDNFGGAISVTISNP